MKNTKENLREKTYSSRPAGKPQKRRTDAMTRDARKLLVTAGWK
jgi:hypothetical protein